MLLVPLPSVSSEIPVLPVASINQAPRTVTLTVSPSDLGMVASRQARLAQDYAQKLRLSESRRAISGVPSSGTWERLDVRSRPGLTHHG